MKIDHNTNVLLSIGQRACLGRRPTSYFTTSEANISALFEATETPDIFISRTVCVTRLIIVYDLPGLRVAGRGELLWLLGLGGVGGRL